MIKKLLGSVREFKLFSLLSPLFVVLDGHGSDHSNSYGNAH